MEIIKEEQAKFDQKEGEPETLAHRLVQLRQKLKISQHELSRKTGVNQGTISNLESGKQVDSTHIKTLADFYNVHFEWLVTGKGDPLSRRLLENYKQIPILSEVQAGLLTEAVEYLGDEITDFIFTKVPCSDKSFALTVRDNSMEPGFYEGDLLIVDPSKRPEPGDFVIAKDANNQTTFKKYRQVELNSDGHVVFELISLNEDFRKMRSDREPLAIIGVSRCIKRHLYCRRSSRHSR